MNVSLMFVFSGNFQFETGLLAYWLCARDCLYAFKASVHSGK